MCMSARSCALKVTASFHLGGSLWQLPQLLPACLAFSQLPPPSSFLFLFIFIFTVLSCPHSRTVFLSSSTQHALTCHHAPTRTHTHTHTHTHTRTRTRTRTPLLHCGLCAAPLALGMAAFRTSVGSFSV
ncbi:hypothetical protein PTSG_11846 [Salpingoeca rosetta]|uniref:Uncharacterized protein n=1 Tax=Salpingoeca rosetta (strain ATCC 50818 / BSB-021) TaxID=946362 RepID=F2U1E9_SALR5|nr:uncharacterized protein PTSG_11846 [Salpingoeca rosetta]EGD81451.1 hypothetical protein PTSG_11846 [Salpingoeca rosetta]|eukprot:XP_004996655.1 hypothetical protein PTSG_11846 [Salpingoeca rosetta]